MAAKETINNTSNAKEIIFIAGSNNPYNYNSIDYDDEPSRPSNKIWRYNIDTNK